jgi:hypothetical protein
MGVLLWGLAACPTFQTPTATLLCSSSTLLIVLGCQCHSNHTHNKSS